MACNFQICSINVVQVYLYSFLCGERHLIGYMMYIIRKIDTKNTFVFKILNAHKAFYAQRPKFHEL